MATTLSTHSWPGNLRELRAVVERVVSRRRTGGAHHRRPAQACRTQEPSWKLAPIDRVERTVIVEALRAHERNKVRAGQALGISRSTLYAKMSTLRITVY